MPNSAIQSPSTRSRQVRFFLVLLCVIVAGYVHILIEEIEILRRATEQPVALKVRSVIPPFLFMMPAFYCLIFGLYQRLRGCFSDRKQQRGLMIIIGCFPLFLLAWWLYSWQLDNWLEDKGYTSCSWYSGATLGAPTIWLKNQGYCIEDGYPVRIKLLDWLEAQRQQGITPTVEVFKQQQEQILELYRQRYSQ